MATSSSNLLKQPRASSDSTDSSLLDLQHTSSHVYDFEISPKGFRSSDVDLAIATRFQQHLIINLVPIDTYGVRRLQNLSNLTRVSHKSSKSLQSVVRVVDTVFCLPSICMQDPEKSKNVIFSPQGRENIQNDVMQPVQTLEHPKCLFQLK